MPSAVVCFSSRCAHANDGSVYICLKLAHQRCVCAVQCALVLPVSTAAAPHCVRRSAALLALVTKRKTTRLQSPTMPHSGFTYVFSGSVQRRRSLSSVPAVPSRSGVHGETGGAGARRQRPSPPRSCCRVLIRTPHGATHEL